MAYDADGIWYEEYPDYIGGGTDTTTEPDNTYVPYDNSGGQPGGSLPGTGVQMPPDAPAGASGQDANGNWFDSLGNLVKQVSPILGPIIKTFSTPWLNNIQSGGLLNKASDYLQQGANAFGGITNTNLMALIPQLQKQVQQGTMTPAQAQAMLQEASNMRNVASDQGTLSGARDALAGLADIGENQGMTQADRAAFAAYMQQQAAKTASDRKAQIQQMQMQGNAGTGTELAARLSGVQGDANTNAMAGANMAQAAQARALAALQSGVQGNTALNQQMFSQDADKAKAQDAINQFNAAAKNAVSMANAGYQQNANLTNFNMANTIAGKNVDIQNQQNLLPLSTANQQFQNQLGLAKGVSGAQLAAGKQLGDMATGQITRTANASATAPAPGSGSSGSSGSSAIDDIGKAVSIGSSLWNLFSDEKLKTDKKELTDAEVDKMMGNLTGFKYRYKGDNNPMKAGVMAQDMEDTMGSVVDTPAGKMIQGPESMSKALAVLANQHHRIRKLEGNK